jgi:hypothetical protein
MGWNVARKREKIHTKFLYESLEESDHLEDLGEDNIKMVLQKEDWRVCIGFFWFRIGATDNLGNEPVVSIGFWTFRNLLNDY